MTIGVWTLGTNSASHSAKKCANNFARISLVALALFAGTTISGCGNQRPAHIVLKDADRHAEWGRTDQAIADYEEFLRRRPEDAAVRARAASQYLEAGNPGMAIEHLLVATDVEPLNDDYLDQLAEAYFQAGQREALTAFLQRTTSERGRTRDFLRLGRFSAKLGNPDEAQQALLTAAKLDRGASAEPQLALSDFYGSVGDTARQLDRLRMAYFIRPEDPKIEAKVIELGETPGPSFGRIPLEAR